MSTRFFVLIMKSFCTFLRYSPRVFAKNQPHHSQQPWMARRIIVVISFKTSGRKGYRAAHGAVVAAAGCDAAG